jgi:hypothetical protein
MLLNEVADEPSRITISLKCAHGDPWMCDLLLGIDARARQRARLGIGW